ncbi:MAG: hypothetical protein LBS55_10970 [Prevotellaceae bacterium]|jgi:hypothetical protein|nr:hypothetical protein [Prevotellaceae bacterium]
MIPVPYLPLTLHTIDDVPAQALTALTAHPVACVNWATHPYAPAVTVKIAHTPSHLLLQYDVREKSIRAQYTQCNQSVWTDSCVEFFVSLDQKKTYYNFEFNCIGTPLLRHNVKPHEGTYATPELLSTLLTKSSLGNSPIAVQQGDFTWQLLVAIPYTCFFAHQISDLRGQTLLGNCYKCGDELPDPHFLSLFPIRTPTPNFHAPEFFGELVFGS